MQLVVLCFATLFADSDSDAAGTALGLFAGFWMIWSIICIALVILGLVINWKIAEKAGYPGVASLLMLIPLVNLFILLYFAFTEWPITRELREARAGGIQPRL
jgi:uncharacterized membrane protein